MELSLARSDGQAAYADRTMDGTMFARNNLYVKFDKRNISSLLARVEAQWYYNYVDHLMDNYSLRTPGATYSVNNPDRITAGGRFAATLSAGSRTTVVVGADTQRNVHRMRSAANKSSAALATGAYLSAPRAEDMRFNQLGLFAEATQLLSLRGRIIGGFRTDWQKALDSRMCVNASMCPGDSPLKNDTRGMTDRKTLFSGFSRYELDIKGGTTLFAGL